MIKEVEFLLATPGHENVRAVAGKSYRRGEPDLLLLPVTRAILSASLLEVP
jgi:hypothetical protein